MLNYRILEQTLLFQHEIDKGYFSDEYYFYDLSKTIKHWKMRPDQVVSLIKDEFNSKWVVVFEGSILYNVNPNTICSNVPLTYIKKPMLN